MSAAEEQTLGKSGVLELLRRKGGKGKPLRAPTSDLK